MAGAARVEGVRLSLWRAAALYRVVTLAFCDYLIFVRWKDLYAHPVAAFATGAAMTVVTAVVGWLAVSGRAHRAAVVAGDLAVTVALTLLTIVAQTAEQQHGGMPTLTTLWGAGPVLGSAIVSGVPGGVVASAVQSASTLVVHDGYDGRTVLNGIVLVIAGIVVGYVATLAARSEAQLAEAVAARSAVLERERLARTVHDGALQILALVHRTGRDEPGQWGVLAREAGAQEARLRALVTSQGEPDALDDLATALRSLRSERVSVAAPAPPPALEPHVAAELLAAVRAALDNVERHAGSGAHAWVFVEELPDEVRVTVRDDGAGFEPGRLAEAERSGRLGVASSVKGRIAAVGGTVHITSRPGEGTVVELAVPA